MNAMGCFLVAVDKSRPEGKFYLVEMLGAQVWKTHAEVVDLKKSPFLRRKDRGLL
jgi:hypothetical protein